MKLNVLLHPKIYQHMKKVVKFIVIQMSEDYQVVLSEISKKTLIYSTVQPKLRPLMK